MSYSWAICQTSKIDMSEDFSPSTLPLRYCHTSNKRSTTLGVHETMLVQTFAVHHPKDNMASVSLSSARTCPRRPQGVQPPLTVVIDNDVRPRTTSRKLSKPYLRYHARLAPPRVRVACADDVGWTVYDRRTRQMRTQRAMASRHSRNSTRK